MTFEEFFKKKKISLQTFEQGEPALFSEFKTHYEQMGEKSFDHTKKYWFNKLRLRFPAPVEIKAEKIVVENPLAEQTITESLIESSSPPPNIGFKPKFRAGVTKPAASESTEEVKNTEPVTNSEHPAESQEQVAPTPPLGFKPKFRAGVTKSVDPIPVSTETKDTEPATMQESPAENPEQISPPPPLGFKPKFRAGVTKPAAVVPEQKEEPRANQIPPPPDSEEANEAKPAYKPRFNMKNIKHKPPEE